MTQFKCLVMLLTTMAGVGASKPSASNAPPGSPPDKTLLFYAFDFEKGTNGWTLMSGAFQVENGSYRSRAITAENKLSRAIIGDNTWRDYTVEARLKLEQSVDPKADFGIFARYQDPNNYYLFLYKIESQTMVIERKLKGKLQVIAEAPLALEAGKWHDFKGTLFGGNLAVEVDGKKLAEVADENFNNGGAGLLVYWADASCARFNVHRAAAARRDAK